MSLTILPVEARTAPESRRLHRIELTQPRGDVRAVMPIATDGGPIQSAGASQSTMVNPLIRENALV